MDYSNQLNLLLEALSYLGRRTSGNTLEYMEQRLKEYDKQPDSRFWDTFFKLKELTSRIDKAVSVSNEDLQTLFGNLEGFQHNTIGSTSAAFLLFYPVLEKYECMPYDFSESERSEQSPDLSADRKLDLLLQYLNGLQPEQVIRGILETLDLMDDRPEEAGITCEEFMDIILSLSVPDKSKLAILNISRNYTQLTRQAVDILRPVLASLERNLDTLTALTEPLTQQIAAKGSDYFWEQTHLKPVEGTHYRLRPFVFGMDTNLTTNPSTDTVNVYNGILWEHLLKLTSGKSSIEDEVYNIYKMLGDRTRFDLLCYLRNHNAYGLELSTKFNLSRNTIHYHMNKLMACGLISCTNDGNRIYYSLNDKCLEQFLTRQKKLLQGKSPE